MFSPLFSTFIIIYKGYNTGCWSKVIETMIRIIKLRNFILFCSLSFFIFTVNSRFFLYILAWDISLLISESTYIATLCYLLFLLFLQKKTLICLIQDLPLMEKQISYLSASLLYNIYCYSTKKILLNVAISLIFVTMYISYHINYRNKFRYLNPSASREQTRPPFVHRPHQPSPTLSSR